MFLIYNKRKALDKFRKLKGAYGGEVDGVVDVMKGHGKGLEGQHHALARL